MSVYGGGGLLEVHLKMVKRIVNNSTITPRSHTTLTHHVHTPGSSTVNAAASAASTQLEVFAVFVVNVSAPPTERFGVEVLVSPDGRNSTKLFVDCARGHDGSMCSVGVDGSNCTAEHRRRPGPIATGPLLPVISHPPKINGEIVRVTLHAYVDHGIVEVIFNNRTAFAFSALDPGEGWGGARLFGAVPQNHTLQMWNLKGIHDE